MGGVQKGQKYADVIKGWSLELMQHVPFMLAANSEILLYLTFVLTMPQTVLYLTTYLIFHKVNAKSMVCNSVAKKTR